MSKIPPLFSWQNLKGLLFFIVINMAVATIAYFVFDYNLYLPLLAGAFGGFFGGYFWNKKKVVKQ